MDYVDCPAAEGGAEIGFPANLSGK